jgi:hypothetical protein
MSYNHETSTQKLNAIMATRTTGKQVTPKKVNIIDALADIQSAYTKAGRNIPSFGDSIALIDSQRSV